MNNEEVDKNKVDSTTTISEVEVFKQKVKAFKELKQPIHVSFKDGHYKNGYIQKIASDFFILDEFIDQREFIFFSEVKRIDIFRTQEEFKRRGEFESGA